MRSDEADRGGDFKLPKAQPRECVTTGVEELDRLLGGGLTKGSTVVLSSDPGGGRLTVAAMIAAGAAAAGRRVRVCSENVEGATGALRRATAAALAEPIVPTLRNWPALLAELQSAPPDLLVLDLFACDGYSHAAIFGARGVRGLCARTGVALLVVLPEGHWAHVRGETDAALTSESADAGVTVKSSRNRYAQTGSALIPRAFIPRVLVLSADP